MINKGERYIILENKNQATEYLDNIQKFQGVIPIVFSLSAEALLLKNKISFKIGEEYANNKPLPTLSIKKIEEIIKKVEIEYRGIDLFQLFYDELTAFLISFRRYFNILKNMKEREKIGELTIFENINKNPHEELYSRIAKEIFKEKIRVIKYRVNKKRNRIVELAGFFQNLLAELIVIASKRTNRKIFFCGNKNIFELIIKNLPEKRNKIFRCSDVLQKSFFVKGRYVPAYRIKELKTKQQKELIKDILSFKTETKNLKFLENLGLEKELIPILKEWISYYVEVRFLEVSGIIDKIIELIRKRKIDLILLYNDVNVFEKTLAQVGRKFNVPSIVIQHGIIGNRRGFLPKSADYLLVFGEQSKKQLMKFGYPKESIIITGSPQFDKYSTIAREYQQNHEKKRIVFIMGSLCSEGLVPEVEISKERWKQVYFMLFNVLKKFPEYELVIKWKGRENLDFLPLLIGRENLQKTKIASNANPIELLSSADTIILTDSTMALDALLLGKPVISINFKDNEKVFKEKEVNPYKNSGPIINIYNEKQLEDAIKKIKSNKTDNSKTKVYLEKELFKLDGKASERVVKFIVDLLNRKDRLHLIKL